MGVLDKKKTTGAFEERRELGVRICNAGSGSSWWASWIRREIRELGMGEVEFGKFLARPDKRKKRRRCHSAGDVERVSNPEELGVSRDEGQVLGGGGDLWGGR